MLAEFWRSLFILQSLRFTASTQSDSIDHQAIVNHDSADLHLLGETQNGTTGHVFADNVIRINIQSWHGDIFNLETEQGHYTSNNIITHNCLCLTAPFIDINPKIKPKFNPNAEQSFLAGLPPNAARQIAGSREKLERALKDGESLEDIYNEGKDDLYKWRKVGDILTAASATTAGGAVSNAYEVAKAENAPHHGWLKQYEKLPDHLIRKSIRSIQKRIQEHEAWIKTPALKLGDVSQVDPRALADYINHKWPSDIRRQQEQIAILQGILEARNG